jgi:16S rRNA (guanine966-N2)-methyltransferase
MSRRELGRLRIIGGQWRSRIVAFDASAGVRPTPDRVRQTLFDWLSPRIDGAACLDLFAGSGALGIEALSRGAASVSFIEQGRVQVEAIRTALKTLGGAGEVVAADSVAWLAQAASRYDLVFLDPPYASDLLARVLPLLPARLKPGARVFIEWPQGAPPALPPELEWRKERQAGQVSFGLAAVRGDI